MVVGVDLGERVEAEAPAMLGRSEAYVPEVRRQARRAANLW